MSMYEYRYDEVSVEMYLVNLASPSDHADLIRPESKSSQRRYEECGCVLFSAFRVATMYPLPEKEPEVVFYLANFFSLRQNTHHNS